MRLIDADEFASMNREAVRSMFNKVVDEAHPTEEQMSKATMFLEAVESVLENLEYAPTIDAVPINRCKTCTFWDTDANEPDDLHNGLCTLNKIGTSDYFYCGAWTKDTQDFFNGDRDDWVSVVRCKDCKCWTEWDNGTGSCSRFALDWIGTDADDFCSMGERKDDE